MSKIDKKQFTAEELQLIRQNPDAPFRVLVVDEPDELEILRKVSEPVAEDCNDDDFRLFIERMKKTLEVEQGVGLAAPQAGVLKRVFLFMRTDKEDLPVEVAINPEIVNHSQETVCFEDDGCLSIPGRSGDSERYPWIDVKYTNERGERVSERLEGHSREDNFAAIIFQHEFDHLNGVLYVDRLCKQQREEEE